MIARIIAVLVLVAVVAVLVWGYDPSYTETASNAFRALGF